MSYRLEIERAAYISLKERLKSEYDLDENSDVLIDSLEGASDLPELLAGFLRQALHNEANAEAISTIIKGNQERKARLEHKADRLRALVAETMLEVGLAKLPAPDMTVNVRVSKPKPEIVDEASLPDFYTKRKTVPDRDAIKSEYERCLAENDTFCIPGVEVSNGSPVLTIRTK